MHGISYRPTDLSLLKEFSKKKSVLKIFIILFEQDCPEAVVHALVHASEKISSHCYTGALILTMRVVLCSSSDNVFESSLSDFDRLPQLGHVSKTQ